jgi:hypothetical protein
MKTNGGKTMKKATALLCALCILCFTAAALAAPGDAYLFSDDARNEMGITNYNTPTMAAIGDTVYTLWGSELYTWQIGADAPVKLVSDIPFGYYSTWEDAQATLGDDAEKLITVLVSDGSTLYGFNSLNGLLYPLTFADGHTEYGTPTALDWTEIQDRQNGGEYLEIFGLKIVDGALYLLVRSYDDYEQLTLMSFDLASGKANAWDIPGVQDITPYRDGNLLVEIFDSETAYNSDTGEMANATLAVFNPADGSVTEIGEFSDSYVFGIVYDAASDTLYYTTNSKLMAMPSLGEPVQVAYMPVDYIGSATACLLPGGLYALIAYQGLIVRNTDPQYMPAYSLSIYGGYIDDAATAFMTEYPDIPLMFDQDTYYSTASAMAQAMASGDNTCDIYNISMSYQDFNNLMSKGYCLNLSPYAELTNNLGGLYPFLKDAVSLDGDFYAVPTSIYAYGLGYYPEVWEEAGLSDRIPTSFMGFLDFYQWWVDEGMDAYPDLMLMQDAYDYKNMLFNMALNLYITTYQAEGKELTLDTPVFRSMMEALEALDIDALNDTIPEADENGDIREYWDGTASFLFSQYGDWLTVYNYEDYSSPLVLPIQEGEPACIPVYVQCVFVNPNTEHPEMAAEYLAAAVSHMDPIQHILMFPDDNDPLPNDYYETMVEEYETMLADAQASLETAAPEDVKDIQASIDSYEDFLSHKEDYYWTASAESIASYRELTPLCYTAAPNILSYSDDSEGSSEIQTLIDRYLDGQLSMDQFITQADQKIRMIQLEMQ